MPIFEKFRENWVRPALFFGNNPVSLAGGAITTASGVTMVGSWVIEIVGHPVENPYLGIIFSLILPALFILGLALIPVGMFLRRRKLRRENHIPVVFPKIADCKALARARPSRASAPVQQFHTIPL